MKTQSLRTMVEIGDKKLTVETYIDPSKKQMNSSVHSEGQLVIQRDCSVSDEIVSSGESELEKNLSEKHNAFIAELESVFRIRDKISEKPSSDKCFMMGVILLSYGFYGDGRDQFQNALKIDPHHIQAIKYYGISLILLQDFDGAKVVLTEALKTAPNYPDILFYLGNVYLYQRQFEEARQCYVQALQINPDYAEARLKLATTDVGILVNENENLAETTLQGYAEEAQREAKTAKELNPKIVNATLLTAMAYLRDGKYQLAFTGFMNARPKYMPKTALEMICFYTLKLIYEDKGVGMKETETYIRQLEELVETYPNYADIRFHYGIAQLVKSSFIVNRSLREASKAMEVNPNFLKARSGVDVLRDVYKKILLAVRSIYHSEK